jgi:eukaryotic-like serine/threonine-protein kinase
MSSERQHSIEVGASVGPYRIDGVLGAGGMGVVYRAIDCELRRSVAIKMVDRRRHSVDALQLLVQEARAAASLNHPAICGIHEIGHVDGEPFIVMEHVAGTPLSDVIAASAGLSVETAIHYAMQMVDAVAHAHDHGIVHGDLKTSNVMVGSDGRVKLLDFGLAVEYRRESESGDTDSTRPANGIAGSGTVPYMAPELLRGGRADERSDIWALGVVVFEMLAGYRPFGGATTYEAAASILDDPPRPLPARTPAGLKAVVGRCLAKSPPDRFMSARELASALDDLGGPCPW